MLPEKICAFHFRIFTGMLLLRVSSFMCAEFFYLIKGTLSSLRQCLATESPLKIIKSAFYFTLKALLILNIFKFLSWIFGHIIKQLDSKDKVNFKIYVATWLRNNVNTHINQYLNNEAMKFGQFIECVTRKIFLEKVPLRHSLHDFIKNKFLLLYSITWPSFIVWLPSWDIGQYMYFNCLLTRKQRLNNFSKLFIIHNICHLWSVFTYWFHTQGYVVMHWLQTSPKLHLENCHYELQKTDKKSKKWTPFSDRNGIGTLDFICMSHL